MTELEGAIHYWENLLHDQNYIIAPAAQAIIRITINGLKELEKLKTGEK